MSFHRNYAPPVSNGQFFHDGTEFYVKVEGRNAYDLKRHARASSDTIYNLLTYTPPTGPLLTKAGKVAKRQPPPHKDEPGHFYTAQMIHYGLKPPLKTRDAAKKKLLASFDGQKRLTVPGEILKIEKELKAEYDTANAAAAVKHREEKEASERLERERRARMQEAQEALRLDVLNGDDEDPVWMELVDEVVELSKDRLRTLISDLLKDDPSLEDQIRGFMPDPLAKPQTKKSAGKRARSGSDSEDNDHSKKRKKHGEGSNSNAPIPPSEMQGDYTITVPYLSEQWPDYAQDPFKLKLHPSSTSTHLWGTFSFGVVSGILRSHGKPSSTLKFHWRGREAGEDVITYADCNVGTITFLGEGKIKGSIAGDLFKSCPFYGKKVIKSNLVLSKSVPGWKAEWRSLNDSAYEVENVSRWGKWGGEVRPDRPEESDTTDDDGRGSGGGSEDEYADDLGYAF